MVLQDKKDPVNNRCTMREQENINSHTNWAPLLWICLHCRAAPYRRGDMIRQYVDRFKQGLTDIPEMVDGHDTSPLKTYFLPTKDKNDAYVVDYTYPAFNKNYKAVDAQPYVTIKEAQDVFFGKSDGVIGLSPKPFSPDTYLVSSGRHRICAAWRFGVPELPVLVSL